MKLGNKIYEYRKKSGMSQEELGYKLNVSRQSVSLWETDQVQPTLDNLKSLAIIFNVSIDEFLDIQVDKSKTEEDDLEDFLFTASNKYDYEIYKNMYQMLFKKNYIMCTVSIIICCLLIPIILISDINNYVAFIPLFSIILFITTIIKYKRITNNNANIAISSNPNLTSEYIFYQDHFILKTKSDNSNTTRTVKYSEIKKKFYTEKFIYIIFNNVFSAIDRSTCKDNETELVSLLNINVKEEKGNRKIKIFLLILFILSLASMNLGLIFVAIGTELNPIPDFPYTMLENLWLFYLALPIPIISLIIAIIFSFKGYRCIKVFIGSSIAIVMCFLFGSIGSMSDIKISHDKRYINEISDSTNIDFPDVEYISISYEENSIYDSYAMIKFENEKEFEHYLLNNNNWNKDRSFLPIDFLDFFTMNLTAQYEYFTVYNLDNSCFNDLEGKLIYMAYDYDTKILFVLCF